MKLSGHECSSGEIQVQAVSSTHNHLILGQTISEPLSTVHVNTKSQNINDEDTYRKRNTVLRSDYLDKDMNS